MIAHEKSTIQSLIAQERHIKAKLKIPTVSNAFFLQTCIHCNGIRYILVVIRESRTPIAENKNEKTASSDV